MRISSIKARLLPCSFDGSIFLDGVRPLIGLKRGDSVIDETRRSRNHSDRRETHQPRSSMLPTQIDRTAIVADFALTLRGPMSPAISMSPVIRLPSPWSVYCPYGMFYVPMAWTVIADGDQGPLKVVLGNIEVSLIKERKQKVSRRRSHPSKPPSA